MMHDKARARIIMRIRNAAAKDVDAWLDLFFDSDRRATEWDAKQWGFNPSRWMESERTAIARRGGRDWPIEVTY